MTIPWTGTAGYFTRQGAIVGEFNRVSALYGSDLTNGFQAIWSQFASSDQAAVQNLPDTVAAYRLSGQQYQRVLQADGAQASVLQVSDYYSVVPSTLQQSFIVLIAQMKANSQTIQRATLTSSVTPWGSNIGNAKFIVSTINQFGDPIDTIYNETITATCIQAGTNFQETFQAVGQATVPVNSYLWPAGSGANAQFAISNPAATGLLTDGGFENWTGTGNNTPVNWDIVNGSAGVTISRGTGGVRGSFTAVITSDGSSLTALAQSFAAQINTVYAISVQIKINSLDGSGIFRMCLTDGDGNILNDDAGNALSYTRNLNGQVTTSFAIITAFFAMPRTLPAVVKAQYGFSTAPTAGKFVTLDLAGLVAGTQLYPGGPNVAAFAQDTPNSLGDYYSLAFTNSLTSQSFAVGMNRLYQMSLMSNPQAIGLQQPGLYFPSSLSATISDSLVTH